MVFCRIKEAKKISQQCNGQRIKAIEMTYFRICCRLTRLNKQESARMGINHENILIILVNLLKCYERSGLTVDKGTRGN